MGDNKFRENKRIETRTSVISANEVQPHLTYWLPVLVQFGVRYLDIVLMSIFEFHENRLSKGRTLVTGINEITFTNYPESVWYLESKEGGGGV